MMYEPSGVVMSVGGVVAYSDVILVVDEEHKSEKNELATT